MSRVNSFLVTTAIPDPGLQLLSDAGTVTVLPEPPDYDTLAALCASGEYDVVLTQLRDVVDAPLLADARVKGVSNYAVGYNNIDVDAATRHGILVGNTPGVLTDATADIAMLLILGTARRVVEADRLVRAGGFHGWEPELLLGRDVSGAVLGLAGFGRIARAAARRALGFGMDVLFAPRPQGDRPVSDGEPGECSPARSGRCLGMSSWSAALRLAREPAADQSGHVLSGCKQRFHPCLTGLQRHAQRRATDGHGPHESCRGVENRGGKSRGPVFALAHRDGKAVRVGPFHHALEVFRTGDRGLGDRLKGIPEDSVHEFRIPCQQNPAR